MSQNGSQEQKTISREEALSCLRRLLGQPLLYGYKFPQWCDLYEFGFGRLVEDERHDDFSDLDLPKIMRDAFCEGGKRAEFVLHAVCPIKVVWRGEERRVDLFDEETERETFRSVASRLAGASITRIELSDKQDLWLDLGEFWLVFVTSENEEESWRFFTADGKAAHLVASSARIELDA